jgi:hypothetical protein
VVIAPHWIKITILVGCLIASASYAFSHAGTPNVAQITPGAAPSYTVTNVSYTLSATDPSSIAMVRFRVVPGSTTTHITTVRAKLISSRTIYSTCANVPAGSQIWECPGSGVTVALADQLAVDVGLDQTQAQPHYLLWLPIVRR